MHITMYCGSYAEAVVDASAKELAMRIITQDVKSGREMVQEGIDAINATGEDVVLFCNNDHFLNGLRLALKNQQATPDQLSILFCVDGGLIHQITVNENGQPSSWPQGFFDGMEFALSQL